MTRLLIVSPAFNEEGRLPVFLDAINRLRIEVRPHTEVRLLVVDDGSRDGTAAVLRAGIDKYGDWLASIHLAANAGHQSALLAGLFHAGPWPEAIVTMDADLEHPVETVPRLVETWRSSQAVVVHAIRRPHQALSLWKRLSSALFYRVTSFLTGLDLASGEADFKLWDASVLRGLTGYLPNIGSPRVFAAWLPGHKAYIEYDQHVVAGRESRFTLGKNLEMAAVGIIRFSHRPLQAITLLGAIGLTFALVYGVYIAIEAARGRTVPGWSSIVLTVMAMGCLQLVALGVLASYFRRLVFARDLPPWIVRTASLDALRQFPPDSPSR